MPVFLSVSRRQRVRLFGQAIKCEESILVSQARKLACVCLYGDRHEVERVLSSSGSDKVLRSKGYSKVPRIPGVERECRCRSLSALNELSPDIGALLLEAAEHKAIVQVRGVQKRDTSLYPLKEVRHATILALRLARQTHSRFWRANALILRRKRAFAAYGARWMYTIELAYSPRYGAVVRVWIESEDKVAQQVWNDVSEGGMFLNIGKAFAELKLRMSSRPQMWSWNRPQWKTRTIFAVFERACAVPKQAIHLAKALWDVKVERLCRSHI